MLFDESLLTLTITLAYIGLAAALGTAAVSLAVLFKTSKRGTALLYLGMSGFFAYTLVRVLLRAASGILCYRSPAQTVLFYGGLTALHLYFLWDGWRILRGAPAQREGDGA